MSHQSGVRNTFQRGLAALMSALLMTPTAGFAEPTITGNLETIEKAGEHAGAAQAAQAALNQFWDNSQQKGDVADPVNGTFFANNVGPTATPSEKEPAKQESKVPAPEAAPEKHGLGETVMHAFEAANAFFFRQVNKVVPWYKLPTALAVMNLSGLRYDLRKNNLQGTSQLDANRNTTTPAECERWKGARSPNGICNDLNDPDMGRADLPFGRQQPLAKVSCKLPEGMPSAREVSLRLFTRKKFQPAEIVNNTAMIWLQFMVHDWVQPGRDAKRPVEIPLKPGDTWPDKKMQIDGTEKTPDNQRTDGGKGVPTFPNKSTPWWDAGQIYGNDAETQKKVRAYKDGLLTVDEKGLLPLDPAYVGADGKAGIDQTGRNQNYWMGLSMLHTLFSLEHNSIARRLKQEYPNMSDDELFDKARLVNSALLAKIHTVEWTPAILPNPALQIGMKANWWGLTGALFGKDSKVRAMAPKSELLTGIPGTPANHDGTDYSLSHEFDIVYHMHPLVPDTYEIRSAADGSLLATLDFNELQGLKTREVVDRFGMANLFYSLGMSHPGAIRLNNFPKALQNFQHFSGKTGDVAAADITRTRERCVPLYNDFREAQRMPRMKTFEELTGGDKEMAAEISDVYGGDINKVDALVGMFAEPLPPGFGFSDTAFRVFILMASRRLRSDRFFSTDYKPEVYTQVGYDWVENTTFKDVLIRQYPELAPAMQGIAGDMVFRNKWNKLGQ